MVIASDPELSVDTPLMRQYQEIKNSFPDAIVFFRLGDFYEMFGEDAKLAAPILGLVLTSRQEMPMCGVPFHSSSHHIAKLLKAGNKVAVAEQMEEASAGKKLVRREVVRVVTPGTVIEEDILSPKEVNFLLAISSDIVGWGISWLDISTGEFWAGESLNDASRSLEAWIAQIKPSEIIASQATIDSLKLENLRLSGACLTAFSSSENLSPDWAMRPEWRNHPLARRAALNCLSYAMRSKLLKNFPVPSLRAEKSELLLDATAIKTLELTESFSGQAKHSLWGFLDLCKTSMGSRLLKDWILRPLLDIQEIRRRQGSIEELVTRLELRNSLAAVLGKFADIPRIVSRLQSFQLLPRDLGGIRDSLKGLPELISILSSSVDVENSGLIEAENLSNIYRLLEELMKALTPASALLSTALVDAPPIRISEGGVIKEGFNAELDQLRSLKSGSRQHLENLETQERQATGIQNLKVGFNGIFGYYLEVTKSQIPKVPARYTRKQTLANAERYVISELKELENKILGAEEKIIRLEKKIFEEVRNQILAYCDSLSILSKILAELDVFLALAQNAGLNGWAKPEVDLGYDLEIVEGRHPIVASVLPSGSFVSNSIAMDGRDFQIMILTGPNMSGKSTYLRQNALIALMAQIGSFVPAKSARVGIIDRILTRVGASDALAEGSSTFMVEMKETSDILKNATSRSLIILDEVGRGTSTFDGISIAWAILEYLNSHYQSKSPQDVRGPKVLFATHYFELTELAETLKGVFNANVSAKEWINPAGQTEVIFLHKVSEGPADKSYGIHVAALAGLPAQVLTRSQEILNQLENESRQGVSEKTPTPSPQMELDFSGALPIVQTLKLLNPERMTPLEALSALIELKKKASDA
jgi:DNA mismatch repair protein MutS